MQSNEEFGYPEFQHIRHNEWNTEHFMPLTNTTDLYPNMMMNITVHQLAQQEELTFCTHDEEMAFVLIEGHVCFCFPDESREAKRASCIDDFGYCLHVSALTEVCIVNWGKTTAEILVQSTKNKEPFEPVFYTPATTRRETFGQGQFEGKAQRTVSTFFDYASAPYSNMVCGEILIPQGGWSSYPPHEHPQPEVYYYRFGHPASFGACFLDDRTYVIKDRSFAAIAGGKYHPQVNAPGYPMMYVWMIRHFDGYPWTERNFAPEHQWLAGG